MTHDHSDPFALLLEDDSDVDYKEETDIPCLNIVPSGSAIELTIEDWLFADDEYSEKIRILLKYLKNDKDLTKNNKYKTFDLTIDLTDKEPEIQENNPLYALKYIIELSKKYITSLSIYITAFRDNRSAPFNIIPDPLDNDVLSNIFNIIQESICKYRLNHITIHWIPVNISNYQQLTDGIINIFNITPNQIQQQQKQIPIHILFSCLWLSSLSCTIRDELMHAIKQCKICNDLTLRFDKDAQWLVFDRKSLHNMVFLFNAIGNNPYIKSLSIFADNFVSNNIAFGVEDNDDDREYNIVNALSNCLQHKTIETLHNNNDIFEHKDFSLSLSLDANDGNHFLPKDEAHLWCLLEGLYDNDNICLDSLCLYRNGANWDSKTIRLICDLVESDDNRILQLVLDGDFVSKYSFGMYKVVGFDKLVDCLTNEDDDDDVLELKILNVGTILDDGDSDVYNHYVIHLIEECNIWLSSITIKYERFNASLNQMIEAFFNRLQKVYDSLESIRNELLSIFLMEDIVNLIVDFCKMESFEIFIVDEGDNGHHKTMDLSTERAEFRDCLYSFLRKIQFKVTSNIGKNREFQTLREKLSKNSIGIWRYPFKRAERCVSVIL